MTFRVTPKNFIVIASCLQYGWRTSTVNTKTVWFMVVYNVKFKQGNLLKAEIASFKDRYICYNK